MGTSTHEYNLTQIDEAIRRARAPIGTPYVPKAPNLAALLAQVAAQHPTKTYLSYYDDDRSIHRMHRYQDVVDSVAQTAGFLKKAGVKRGHRVAFLIGNLDYTAILYLATWSLGASVAPINASEDFERKSFIAENSGAKILFARTDYVEEAIQLASRHRLRLVLVNNQDPQRSSLNDELKNAVDDDIRAKIGKMAEFYPAVLRNDVRVEPETADFDGQDVEALLIYTSGTTGAPKGVRIDQKSIMVDAEGMAKMHAWDADLVGMCVLPIHHVNGIVVTCCTPLYVGGTTVLNARFNTRTFWQRIQDEQVHFVSVVPTLLEFLIHGERRSNDAPPFASLDTQSLETIICGAGPLLIETALAFEDTFGVKLTHGYGLSETTCYNSHMPPDLDRDARIGWYKDHQFPSIGTPLAYQEMAILNPDGTLCGPGERGEIAVRGECVCMGYDNRPDANASSFKHGWFLTGDEGFFLHDAHGRPLFFITGRIKEIIIRGGVNYAPLEIDEVLNAHPAVQSALAIPFANRYYGEEIAAYVVLHEGETTSEDEILAHCTARLEFSKSPKVIVFGEDIPYTTTGKPQRIQLAAALKETLARYRDTQFRKQ